MTRKILVTGFIAALFCWGPFAGAARYIAPPPEVAVNRGVVELETGRAAGISVRIAEDLANVIDDGATRRVLPVVGKGALQNISDLDLLHGIDMAILQDDVLNYARQPNVFPGLENRITYIAKLYNEEFHLLARRDIKTVADLANQKVNVDLRGAGTEITATRLFNLLNVPIVVTNDDQQVALEKLQRGEIAAMAFVAGKPAPIFSDLISANGLHFLAIPLNPAVTAAYVPTRLTADDYPASDRIRSAGRHDRGRRRAGGGQSPAGTDRYRNLVNFVDAFFTGFQSLLDARPSSEMARGQYRGRTPGLAALSAGRRMAAEQRASRGRAQRAGSEVDLRALYRRAAAGHGRAPLTQQQKDELFGQFQLWQKGQAAVDRARGSDLISSLGAAV